MSNEFNESRRGLLKKAAGLTAVAAGLVAAGAGTAQAAGMAPASVQYQTKPKDGHQCDGCALYVPGASATAVGKCKAVSGPIAPTGWCTLWAPKG
ncbi:hypothetical protein ACOSOMT5_P1615 [Acidiphilium sp. MT5]|jgi:hypothetical protein